MKSVKLDKGKDLLTNIEIATSPNKEEVLNTFEVAPIDYKPKDYSTPKLALTGTKLIFTYDDILEIYDLANLEIDVVGTPPRFTVWEMILEGNYTYSEETEEQARNMKTDESLTRFSFAEPNLVSKDFLLRKGKNVEKSHKTWAMGRIIMNTKLGIAPNRILAEMLDGYFSVLNQKTVIAFIASFLIYFVLKPIAFNFLPGFINTILDIALAAVLVFMAWWLYMTATSNLNRYKTVYLSYKA